MTADTKEQPIKKIAHAAQEVDSILQCPSCDKPFVYHKKLEFRAVCATDLTHVDADAPLPTDLSERQQDAILEIVTEGRVYAATTAMRALLIDDKPVDPVTYSKPFPCPSCGTHIQALIQMVVFGAVATGGPAPQIAPDAARVMTEEDRRLWEEWTESGFIKNFFDAGEVDNPSFVFTREKHPATQLQTVKNWFRTAVPKDLPSKHRAQLIAEYNTAKVACFTAQGVVAILADGVIKCLMPKSTIFDYKPKEQLVANGNGQAAIEKAPPVERWIRTRYGYALAGTMFFSALQQESIGAFGRATQSQRQTRSGLPVAADEEEEQ